MSLVAAIEASEKDKYKEVFSRLKPKNGLLPGADLRQTLQKSGLLDAQLGRLWELSDVDKDGSLDVEEFALMMHLIKHVKQGGQIPHKLPDHLIPLKQQVAPAAAAVSANSSVVNSPVVVNNANAAATFFPDRRPSVPEMSTWVVDNTSLERSKINFIKLDRAGMGRVPGKDLKTYFMGICSDQSSLVKVWNLSDTKSQGSLSLEEFALAEWLIENRVNKGMPLPQTTLPNMVPPSTRGTPPLTPPALPPRGVPHAPGQPAPGGPSPELLQYLNNPVLAPLAQDLINLEKEKSDQMRAIEEKKSQVSKFTVDNERTNIEIRQLTFSVRTMEEESTSAGAKLDQLEIEIRRFEDKIKQVQAECVKQSKDIEELGKNIRLNGEDASRKREELLNAESELSQLINEEQMLERKLKDSQEQLSGHINPTQFNLTEELNRYKSQLATRGIPFDSSVPLTNGTIEFDDPFAKNDPFQTSESLDHKDPFASHDDPFTNSGFALFNSNSSGAPARPPPPSRPPPPKTSNNNNRFNTTTITNNFDSSDPFGGPAVFSTTQGTSDPFSSYMHPSSSQSIPTNDPFASVNSQNESFTPSAGPNFFSKDPFGAPFTNASNDAFGNNTASAVNDPFASDPFGAASFGSAQPSSGDAFSSGFGTYEPNNPLTSAQEDPVSVYDDLNPNSADLPVSTNQFSVAPPTTSSTDNMVYSSLNSDTKKSTENASYAAAADHVYADISKNQTAAFGGPKSLDWFLSQPPEKDKESGGGKNTASKSAENLLDNFDVSSSGFTNTFATDSKDSSIKAETNSTETFSTNPSFNVTTAHIAEEVASKLIVDQNKQTTNCDENTLSDENAPSEGHQNLECLPPDIQITPVATVDQNASDYEPEEMDPHPTPAGVTTPEDEEGASTPTDNPDHPTDQVESVLTQHSTESDTGAGSAAESAPESRNVNNTEEGEPVSSIEGDSNNFVATDNITLTSSSQNVTENKESVSSAGPMVRPSIELDESSTEHEYHVSPSNEKPIEEDPFVVNNQPAEDVKEYETLKHENGIDSSVVSESLDPTTENACKTAFADPDLELVATPETLSDPFKTDPVSENQVDPFGLSGAATGFEDTGGFVTEEAQKVPPGFGDDGFGDAFGAEEVPSNCCPDPIEATATGFDDQFSF